MESSPFPEGDRAECFINKLTDELLNESPIRIIDYRSTEGRWVQGSLFYPTWTTVPRFNGLGDKQFTHIYPIRISIYLHHAHFLIFLTHN